MSFNKNFNNKAHAPYNFIPLNEKVAKFSAPCILDDNKHNSFNTLKGISGEINLTITTKTPFFIGDSEKENDKKYKDFFSVDGKPQIPGSSLRGMIRNLVEIVSYGKFETYNNDKFYYRDVAGRSGNSLKITYKAVMTNDNKHVFEVKEMGGYLKQDDKNPLKFYITPANVEKRKQAKQKNMSINIIDKNKGVYDVFSGFMKDKKAYYHFNGKCNDKKAIELSHEDIKLYNKDNEKLKREKTTPGSFINVVYSAKYEKDKYPLGVPCFYVEYKGRVYFGHTPYFRIPYFKSVKEHMPEYEFGKNEFDLAECIFGKESAFATRVFFEDAKLGENQGNVFAKDRSAVLMEPKPTSFNMYLENKVGAKLSQIKHYNDEVNIRGYKMYHHKTKISDNLGNGNDNVTSKIHEINSNVVFNGKIRFTNLKDYELGALMFVLNLPKNCFHKLGGAKPLGLGSVEIKASLSVYDITKSYENLFSENDVSKLSLNYKTKDYVKELLKNSTKAFESAILEKINSNNTSLWDEPRLKELEIMLNYEKSKNINSEYMHMNDFKHKDKVLPKPSEL